MIPIQLIGKIKWCQWFCNGVAKIKSADDVMESYKETAITRAVYGSDDLFGFRVLQYAMKTAKIVETLGETAMSNAPALPVETEALQGMLNGALAAVDGKVEGARQRLLLRPAPALVTRYLQSLPAKPQALWF
jgi:hypothetical protein